MSAVMSKLVRFFAPLSFSVYIIQCQGLVWNRVLVGCAARYAQMHPAVMALAVLGIVAAIYTVCTMIDFFREKLFSVLGIKKRIYALEKRALGESDVI